MNSSSNTLTSGQTTLNPFSSNFQLSVCDGPAYKGQPNNYRPCDFNGLMLQVQFVINAMIVAGTLLALVSFTWAGFKLVTGGPGEKSRAKEVFRKVGIGFIMMLTAWFIVYTLLDWLAVNPGVKALLGTP